MFQDMSRHTARSRQPLNAVWRASRRGTADA